MPVDYAEIITDKPVQRFLLRFYLSEIPVRGLVLVSPIIGTLEGTRVTLDGLCRKVDEKGIPTYVITCSPDDEYHQQAIDTLISYDPIELRFNDSLHSKLYVCLCYDESKNFALLGSANLTRHSMEKNIEIGMMIYGRGQGREIVRELSKWGLERLRTLSNTKLVKKRKISKEKIPWNSRNGSA